jgi:hypothetical protein
MVGFVAAAFWVVLLARMEQKKRQDYLTTVEKRAIQTWN